MTVETAADPALPSPDECVIQVATLEQRYAAWECARPHFASHATPEVSRQLSVYPNLTMTDLTGVSGVV
jgi:hypothetical protein